MVAVTINGRLTEDPKTQEANGYQVTRFSVAARTNRKDANGQYISNFYRCSCFGGTGDTISKHFHKGDGIVVSGTLSVREYVATNGEKKYSLDVELRDFDFPVTRKADGQSGGGTTSNAAPKREAPTPVDVPEDDLPF